MKFLATSFLFLLLTTQSFAQESSGIRTSFRDRIDLCYQSYRLARMNECKSLSEQVAKVAKSEEEKAAATVALAHAWWGHEVFDTAYELIVQVDPRELKDVSDRVRFFSLRGLLEGLVGRPELAQKNFDQALLEAQEHEGLLMETRLNAVAAAISIERWDWARQQITEAQRLSLTNETPALAFRLVELESRLEARQGPLARITARLQDVITLAELGKARVWKARLLRLQGELLARDNRFELARVRLLESESIILEGPHNSEMSDLFFAWVIYLHFLQDDFQGVDDKAFQLAQAATDPIVEFRLLGYAHNYSRDGGAASNRMRLSVDESSISPRQRLLQLYLRSGIARDEGDTDGAVRFLTLAEELARQLDFPTLPPSVPDRGIGLYQVMGKKIDTLFPDRGPEKLRALKESLSGTATAQNAYDRCDLRGKALNTALHLFDTEEAVSQIRGIVTEYKLVPLQDFAQNAVEIGLVHMLAEGDRRGLLPVPRGYGLGDPAAREVLARISREPDMLLEISMALQTTEHRPGAKTGEAHRLAYWGRFLTAVGRFEEAETALKRGLALARQENYKVFISFLHSELAKHYFARRDLNSAVDQIRLAVKTAPDRERAEFLESQIFLEYQAGLSTDQTHERFLAVSEGDSTPRTDLLRALSYFHLNELENAKQLLERLRQKPDYRYRSEYWLARILLTQGDDQTARQLLEALLQEEGAKVDPVTRGDISHLLGPLLTDEEALELYRESARLLITAGAALGSEHELLGLERNENLLKAVVETALRLGRDELAFEYLERARNLSLLEELERSDPDGEAAALLKRLKSLRHTLSKLQSSENANIAVLARTRQDFFTTLARIGQTDPKFERLINFRAGDLSRVQSLLPSNSLLLMPYPGRDSLRLMVVTPTAFQTLSVPIGSELLTSKIREYYDLNTDRTSSKEELMKVGRELYSWFLAPLGSKLDEVNSVFFVPTADIWYLPLASLPTKSGVVTDDFAVSLLTSAELSRLSQPAVRFEGSELSLFSTELPGARYEIETISRNVPGSRVFSSGNGTSEAVVRESQKARFLHLATHGYVKQDQLDESYLELADGPFTLADIYQLRLRPGALVVLSACKTGVAQNEPGREVTSLANGFMTAGAGSVVASLWPVDDEVTSRLFIRFYAYLDQGLGRAEALRRAQSDIATNPQTAHPYYWAAFFLYGDPR